MHMDPHVLNYRTRDKGPRLRPGMCLAIEPMLTAGVAARPGAGRRLDRGHRGRPWAAHWEHTVALTTEGLWVLTAPTAAGRALAALGVPRPAASRP